MAAPITVGITTNFTNINDKALIGPFAGSGEPREPQWNGKVTEDALASLHWCQGFTRGAAFYLTGQRAPPTGNSPLTKGPGQWHSAGSVHGSWTRHWFAPDSLTTTSGLEDEGLVRPRVHGMARYYQEDWVTRKIVYSITMSSTTA